MKKTVILNLMFVTLISFGATEKNVSSTIKHVNVYLSSAEISREASVLIPSGNVDVILEGLSNVVDPNSIRVSGSGSATIMSVNYRINYLQKNKKSTEQINLENQIDLKQDELTRLNSTISVYNEEMDLLNKNKQSGGANTGVNWENLENLADLYRERMLNIHSKLFDLNKQHKKTQQELNDFKNQLNVITGSAKKPTGEIVIKMYSKTSQNINLSFNYLVYNAGWTPNYDVRATDNSNKVKVVFKANVFQNTGVNWDNIPISISTNNPTIGGVKPNLNTWYLSIYQEYKNKRTNQGYAPSMSMDIMSAAKSADNYEKEEIVEEIDFASNYVTVTEKTLATQYDIELKQEIPADGKQHTVQVKSYDVSAFMEHASVPKLNKDAFLLAQITQWQQYDFLPGEANVFLNETYVGKAFFDTELTSDTMPLSLGIDQKVVLTREKIKDYCKTKSFGLNVKRQFGYEITIKNNKSIPVKINLEDQVPVSTNEQIEVEVVEISGASHNINNGFLKWELNLKPGESKKIVLKYDVKHPKKLRISNL